MNSEFVFFLLDRLLTLRLKRLVYLTIYYSWKVNTSIPFPLAIYEMRPTLFSICTCFTLYIYIYIYMCVCVCVYVCVCVCVCVCACVSSLKRQDLLAKYFSDDWLFSCITIIYGLFFFIACFPRYPFVMYLFFFTKKCVNRTTTQIYENVYFAKMYKAIQIF